MKNKLLTADVWTRIRKLSQCRGRRYVAVPFLGVGARKQLALGRGDVLVVRFDAPTVKAGATDPREILHYLRKGVSVHSIENLHAKVFVLGRTAIIGSTNISRSSENTLVEAAVETTDSGVVGAARTFVNSLRGDIVEPQFAKRMLKLYKAPRPPRKPPSAPPPKQSILWAVPLVQEDWEDEDYRQEKFAKAEARKRLEKPRLFGVEDFLWYGGRFLDHVKLGQRVMMCTDVGKRTMVTPPGRVIAVRRYKHKRSRRMIVCLAIRQKLRRKELRQFVKTLGVNGKPLKKLTSPLRIRNPLLSYKIGTTWPTAENED
jgi:hypothetical protein